MCVCVCVCKEVKSEVVKGRGTLYIFLQMTMSEVSTLLEEKGVMQYVYTDHILMNWPVRS